jgi:NADH dehydrogenase
MANNAVTVFGGSGFVGRQIVKYLVADGWKVRVAVRHPERATFLKDYAESGQVKVLSADVWEEESVIPAVKGAKAVINTVGHYVSKGNATFEAIHGQGALHVARQAKQAGVERLVHISGLGADTGSPSPYIRARGRGEILVRETFGEVTILRPSVIFGPEDAFLNKLAAMARQAPILPLFGTGATRLQPVFVGDVAEACVRAVDDQTTAGQVFELGGPRIYNYKALLQLVLNRIGRKRLLVPVPFLVWEALATALSILPNPPLTRDQVTLMKADNILTGAARSLQDLGISPTAVEKIMTSYIIADRV